MTLSPQTALQFWEQRYRDDNTPWDRGETSRALLRWLDSGALRPCRILVPGCGRGYEVVELARRGFEVTAVDMSPSAVAHARAALDTVPNDISACSSSSSRCLTGYSKMAWNHGINEFEEYTATT